MHLGMIEKAGQSVAHPLAGGETNLSFDHCSQVVLPWRSAVEGLYEALLRDLKSLLALKDRVHQQQDDVQKLLSDRLDPLNEAWLQSTA